MLDDVLLAQRGRAGRLVALLEQNSSREARGKPGFFFWNHHNLSEVGKLASGRWKRPHWLGPRVTEFSPPVMKTAAGAAEAPVGERRGFLFGYP